MQKTSKSENWIALLWRVKNITNSPFAFHIVHVKTALSAPLYDLPNCTEACERRELGGRVGAFPWLWHCEGERTWGSWERRTSALQPEESLEKIGYGKEIWKRKVAERREEDKEENGGQISYRDSNSVKDWKVSAAIQNGTEVRNVGNK